MPVSQSDQTFVRESGDLRQSLVIAACSSLPTINRYEVRTR